MMAMEEPGKLFDHLLHDIRPLAVAVGDAAPEPSGRTMPQAR